MPTPTDATQPAPDSDRGPFDSLGESNAMLLIGSSVMLLAGTAVVIFASGRFSGDSSLWFIGFILISLSGLAMTAAVFRGLGYPQSNGEAFGLPSGSIRALMAIAVMVLLLIFGLPLVTPDEGPTVPDTKPFTTVKIDCASADAEAKRYAASPVLVTVNKADCVAPPPLAPGAAAPPQPRATIALHANSRAGLPEAQRDQAKTLITALVTLLTTIIGFYFGSQNALNLVKEMKTADKRPPSSAAGGGGGTPAPGSGTTPELPATAETPDDPDEADDGCPSDAEPQPGEAHTADEALPPSEGGVEPAPAAATIKD